MNHAQHRAIPDEYGLARVKGVKYGRILTMGLIANIVAKESGLPLVSIMSMSRKRTLCEKRQLIMYLGKTKSVGNFAEVAAYFGQNHDNAIYAIKHIQNIIDTDKEFANFAMRVKNRL